MKRKISASIIVIVLLSLPVGYLVARDIAVRVLLATHSLVNEKVSLQTDNYKLYHEGDYEGSSECIMTVTEPRRGVSLRYPCSADAASASGEADAGAVPGILGDEVVTLAGATVWEGEPSERLSFTSVVLYSISYLALLYLISLILLRRRPTVTDRAEIIAAAALATYFGGFTGAIGVIIASAFHGDPMLGLLPGACLVVASHLYLERRKKAKERTVIPTA